MWFLLFVALCMTIFFVGVNWKSRLDTHSADNTEIRESALDEDLQEENLETEEKQAKKEFVWHHVTKVRGTSFRDGGLKVLEEHNRSLGNEPYKGNDEEDIKYFVKEWGGREYEWEGFKTENFELVKEPDNPVDENAVKVIVEGHFIGYISKGYAKQLQKYIDNPKYLVFGIAEIFGGRYKYWEDRKVRVGESNVGCKIDLKVKKTE
ncbi:HIRAN domain-containing protein [Streptococcus suis]|nr:HIRAN domain-containing protein [Streptococcus suis]